MTVISPPRRPGTEQDRDLEQRVADLEALIEEARRRARRRRQRNGAAALLLVATGAAAFIGFGGHGGGGAGSAALADGSGAGDQARNQAPPLAALPAGVKPSVFAFDPRRPNVVYVASAHARGGVYVYKTTDGGRRWRPTGARGTGWVSDLLSLTADPRHPGTLYAGTDTAVYKTLDGGRSWLPFNQGLFPPPGVARHYGTPGTPSWNHNNGWVRSVAVDLADSNVVYSAADAVRKSTDGGRTWKTVLLPHSALGVGVSRIAIAPTRPESIYAIAHEIGRTTIYKSTDAGRTWQATGGRVSGLPTSGSGDSFDALAVDAGHPQTVYAAIGGAVLKTTDGGTSWQPATHGLPTVTATALKAGLPAGDVTSLAADPQRSGTLYAGLWTRPNNGGIYKSTDGGRSWSPVESGAGIAAVAVDPTRPATIWAAGLGWTGRQFRILRSTDRGATWATAA